jgi:hypothetical protein
MSQEMMPREITNIADTKEYENVSENWVLYDTCLVGGYASSMNFNDGYFTTFALLGAQNGVPFFNVRNRNHGLAYNNQDTRDQLPWGFKIFSVGVQFFAPQTVLYRDAAGNPIGAQVIEQALFETELPKHCSLTLQTNQDNRLKINSLMAPSGVGIVGGGVAQGDFEYTLTTTADSINPVKGGFAQGMPELKNKWGFRNPLHVPRRATLSCRIDLNEYAREMLATMPGPFFQPFQSILANGTYAFKYGMCGIRVYLGGQRFVQQRGQYHA